MIGIIGKGVVGSAIDYWLSKNNEIIIHAPLIGTTLDELLEETNFAYICVPTPKNPISGEADITIINEILCNLPDGFQAVIKSTIPPGTLNHLEEKSVRCKLYYSLFMPSLPLEDVNSLQVANAHAARQRYKRGMRRAHCDNMASKQDGPLPIQAEFLGIDFSIRLKYNWRL